MAIVGGFDVHRAQITFDYLDTETGEITTGQIRPATRLALRHWLSRFAGRVDVAFAVEGCTGWRFVVEELGQVGIEAHLAEPADTAAQRGRKKRAKTDRADARLQRELLSQHRLPESWIPPAMVQEVRALARVYVALMADRRSWQQRIHAQLFHQGVASVGDLLTAAAREKLANVELSPAGWQVVETALVAIDALSAQIAPLRLQLRSIGAGQPGVRALTAHYGIGLLSGTIIWAELGDCRRFASADQVVRFAGLDITVWSSDTRRSPGRLARQGSPVLRWALYEAAKCASRLSSPDHPYYVAAQQRLNGKRATLSVARKLARRCYHSLRELGAESWTTTHTSPSAAA